MDEKKICFIMCVNDKHYMNEAIYYISRLYVPEGYSVDILSVEDATGMTSGYNEAMNASDAKYKVYLHQDVMIVERNFILKMLDIFNDADIGIIGMVGTPCMASSGVMWEGGEIGKLYSSNIGSFSFSKLGPVDGKYQQVDAVDGFLMATQYDIVWREDIFDKWDFYDASQSFEFRRRGFKVVVPNTDKPWCIHDDGFLELDNYYEQREKFVKEYGTDLGIS